MVGAAETRALIAAGGFTAPSTQRTAVFARASRHSMLFPGPHHFGGKSSDEEQTPIMERDRAARC